MSYLSLGAVVQKIVKPMGQVFTLQDVEAVSSINFILSNDNYISYVYIFCDVLGVF